MAKRNDRKSNLQSKDVVKRQSVNTKSDKIEVEGKVVDVVKEKRDGTEQVFEVPKVCPVCGEELEKEELKKLKGGTILTILNFRLIKKVIT